MSKPKKITRIFNNIHLTAMIKAMRAEKELSVDKTANTVIVLSGKHEVFRALNTPDGWVTRYYAKLLSRV